MKPQHGLTLIELLVAMALTAVLGIMLAALVNGWLKVRERLQDSAPQWPVLEFCLALERHFDGLSLRQLYEKRLPLALTWLDWQPAPQQLQWVAASTWPTALQPTRLQRVRLVDDRRAQRLSLFGSADLYAPAVPRWALLEQLSDVEQVRFSFYQGQQWLAYPSTVAAAPDRGVRLDFVRQGQPWTCTFVLPDTRP